MQSSYVIAALFSSTVLLACGPQSPSARLSENAIRANVATRFGRMDVALANVDAKKKAEFAEKHAQWGHGIRIVDLEVGGMSFVTQDHADVHVSVAWQRLDEATLRVTEITQRWHSGGDGWRLLFEERRGGSVGLFGEEEDADAEEEKDAPPKRTQFPTRVIAAQ